VHIKINHIGIIETGNEAGSYVKIIDDSVNTGGFIILTGNSPDLHDGFDNWVEDMKSLQKYFHESRWRVKWL
jgi:hypothetical protein